MTDWIKIKNEYINGNISYRDLAEKYGISHRQIANVGKAEGWVRERERQHDRISAEIQQKSVEKIIDAEVKRIEKIISINDKALDKLDKALDEIETEIIDGTAVETGVVNTYRLRQIVQSLRDIKEIGAEKGTDKAYADPKISINIIPAEANDE